MNSGCELCAHHRGFDDFVSDNGIETLLKESLSGQEENTEDEFAQELFEKVASAFRNGRVRPSLTRDLEAAMEAIGDFPLAIRSSSILEDSRKLSFAGKYSTRFSANGAHWQTVPFFLSTP